MKRPKIIIDDKIPFIEGVLEPFAEVKYVGGKNISPEHIRNADALIIRTRTKCNAALLRGSGIKFIATATIGFDHIDTDYCRQNEISWTNAPGCNSSSVEQYIVSVLLHLIVERNLLPEDSTIGIVGVGHVGKKVAKVSKALGFNVLLNDPPRAEKEGGEYFHSLEKLKVESDILTFHVPLIKKGKYKTFHMLNEEFIGGLVKKPFIINTSRGEVADNSLLEYAIDREQISGVILDVWENEPDIRPGLLDRSIYGTAHIAGYSTDGKAKGTSMSVRAVSSFFDFGLDNWFPGSIPAPENTDLAVDCDAKGKYEILKELYDQIYSVTDDDQMLKLKPSDFEVLRGNYRLRREPEAFSVRFFNNQFDDLPIIAEEFGFSVLQTNCFC